MWGAYGGEVGPLWALAPGILRLATLFFAGLVMPIPAPRSIEPAPASRLFEALASPRNTSARCHSAIRVSCFKRISQGEFIGALLKLNSFPSLSVSPQRRRSSGCKTNNSRVFVVNCARQCASILRAR